MDFKNEIIGVIAKAVGADVVADAQLSVEEPPNPEMGDYALPCFKLSKLLKKSPVAIASELVEKIVKPDFLSDVQASGAYVNFYINKAVFSESVLSEVIKRGADYGKSDLGGGRNVTIDYSSPNVAKHFHVGHLRSTVIGGALYNIYNAIGYNSVGINHLGDWGTQFGKLIVAYRNWGDKAAIEEKGIGELQRIYVKFHEEVEENPALEDEARAELVKMQEGDQEALSLWKWFNDISLKEYNRVYDKLGVKFDYYTGESFYNDKMDAVVQELIDKKLLNDSEGAKVVDLSEFDMPPCLILRRDGGTLYATRDLATAIYRHKTFNFAKSLYVTALDQMLHFAQFFKVLELMGNEWAKDMVHVPFGLVSLETGKLSSRKGQVILMEELLDEAVNKTREIIEEKNPNLENKEEVASQVGIGAVIFNDLYNSRIKDVVFSWDRMLNFEGETGPYVQYTHARAASVLAKEQKLSLEGVDFSVLTDPSSMQCVRMLYALPDKIIDAANKYEPFILTRHLVDIAQAFNKFYHDNVILAEDENIRKARLAMAYCVKTVLASGLAILGVGAPNKM